MTTQNYLVIESNVVTNVCVWNGNVNTWTPPADATMLIQETTPAMVWKPVLTDGKITNYVLTEQMGTGDIGFTWDGTVVTTNEPQPQLPKPTPNQPTTTGTQTI